MVTWSKTCYPERSRSWPQYIYIYIYTYIWGPISRKWLEIRTLSYNGAPIGNDRRLGWSRSEGITVAQLRTGHSPLLASYLHRIGRQQSPLCPYCGGDDETAQHLLVCCPAHMQACTSTNYTDSTDPRRMMNFLETTGAVTHPPDREWETEREEMQLRYRIFTSLTCPMMSCDVISQHTGTLATCRGCALWALFVVSTFNWCIVSFMKMNATRQLAHFSNEPHRLRVRHQQTSHCIEWITTAVFLHWWRLTDTHTYKHHTR